MQISFSLQKEEIVIIKCGTLIGIDIYDELRFIYTWDCTDGYSRFKETFVIRNFLSLGNGGM